MRPLRPLVILVLALIMLEAAVVPSGAAIQRHPLSFTVLPLIEGVYHIDPANYLVYLREVEAMLHIISLYNVTDFIVEPPYCLIELSNPNSNSTIIDMKYSARVLAWNRAYPDVMIEAITEPGITGMASVSEPMIITVVNPSKEALSLIRRENSTLTSAADDFSYGVNLLISKILPWNRSIGSSEARIITEELPMLRDQIQGAVFSLLAEIPPGVSVSIMQQKVRIPSLLRLTIEGDKNMVRIAPKETPKENITVLRFCGETDVYIKLPNSNGVLSMTKRYSISNKASIEVRNATLSALVFEVLTTSYDIVFTPVNSVNLFTIQFPPKEGSSYQVYYKMAEISSSPRDIIRAFNSLLSIVSQEKAGMSLPDPRIVEDLIERGNKSQAIEAFQQALSLARQGLISRDELDKLRQIFEQRFGYDPLLGNQTETQIGGLPSGGYNARRSQVSADLGNLLNVIENPGISAGRASKGLGGLGGGGGGLPEIGAPSVTGKSVKLSIFLLGIVILASLYLARDTLEVYLRSLLGRPPSGLPRGYLAIWCYNSVVRLLAMRGLKKEEWETPWEYYERISQLVDADTREDLHKLTHLYELAKYGGREPRRIDTLRACRAILRKARNPFWKPWKEASSARESKLP